jgi:hypothetical protein
LLISLHLLERFEMKLAKFVAFFGVLFIAITSAVMAQQQDVGTDPADDREQRSSFSFALPVEIVESDAEVQARARSEKEAERRETADLAAQQGMNEAAKAMNDATQRMADYALWSTILVGIGTVLLLLTLYLTRQANTAAQSAVAATLTIGRAQLRPWIRCKLEMALGLLATTGDSLPFGMRVVVENIGQTPAIDFIVSIHLFQEVDESESMLERLRTDLIKQIDSKHIRPGTVLPQEIFSDNRADNLLIDKQSLDIQQFGGVLPSACVVAVYRIAGSNEWHCTTTIFGIYVKAESGTLGFPFPMDGKAIPANGINIVFRRNSCGN